MVPASASTPPAGVEVTVYPVIGEPPLSAGMEKATLAWVLPASASPMTGADGTVAAGRVIMRTRWLSGSAT